MPARPSLLFVTPIVPATSDHGLAMRAGAFLDAFAQNHDVTLLVVPVFGSISGVENKFVEGRCRRMAAVSLDGKLDPLYALSASVRDPADRAARLAAYPRPALCAFATTPCLQEVETLLGGERFDVVHVMRSYLASYAAPFLAARDSPPRTATSLDLDDDEELAHAGLANLFAQRGLSLEAAIETAEARKYRSHEREWLPRFARLIASSDAHAARLRKNYPGSAVSVVPNTVALPVFAKRPRRERGSSILLVGNLSYFPNVDAALFFCDEILPLLRERMRGEVELHIVGRNPAEPVLKLGKRADVTVIANAAELESHYRWADLAVAPIRAGGGTRIKLLEAFAYGVPAVTTHMGADGIAVEDGVHCLLADAAVDFAGACVRMLRERELAQSIAANARRLVEACYSQREGARIICEIV